MDLLKGLIFLLSFYICLSTASVLSGIEELAEFEEALEGKVGSHETPQTYNYNKVKRQKVEDLNVDKGYITGESHVELDGDPSRVQESMEAAFPNGAELLDKQDINTNSALAKMLETMAVVEDGKEKKPTGLHPNTDRKVQEESIDSQGIAETPFVVDDNGTQSDNVTRRGFKRNLSADPSMYWPGGVIPYKFDKKYSLNNVRDIKGVLTEIQRKTCIRFIDANSAKAKALSHNSSVYFVDGDYCKSSIGRINSKQQEIMLKKSTCLDRATIMHEILHTLGFFHEQARSDRDKYIIVHKDRIRHNGLDNFKIQNTINNIPYDAESVLQYSLYSFSKLVNGKVQKTMEFKDPKLEFLSDMSFGLDMYDVAEINNGYKCAAHCKVVPKCKNGGYVNHKCKCDCPSPLKGKTCEEVKTNAGCGGIVEVNSSTTKTIESPNYPNRYPYGKKCVWLIRAPKHDAVKITINELSLPHNANNICYHWLEIRYNLLGQLGPKRCGTIKGQTWVTNPNKEDNLMILIFDAYFGRDRAAATGFQITATSEFRECESQGCDFGTCVKESSGGSRCQCQTGITGLFCDQITNMGSLSCNFESGSQCFLKNDLVYGDLSWISQTGSANSSYTGPQNAKEGTGYMYFESSVPAKQGDTAVLTSRDDIFFSDDTLRCLTFHYSMYGRTIGKLNVYQRGSDGVKQLIFTKSAGQGRDWKYAEVTVIPMPGLRISIEAVRGKGDTGDIGLDDVQLKPGKCIDTPATCTFEPDDYCYWNTNRNTKWQLAINKGKTPSKCTGPNGAYQGQYYIYLEASDYYNVHWRKSYIDYLIPAQEVDFPHCLSFVYHKLDTKPWLYPWFHQGSYNMGKITVRGRPIVGFSHVGTVLYNTGYGGLEDKWYPERVTIPARTRQLEVMLRKGISYCGDISIDDMKLSLHAC